MNMLNDTSEMQSAKPRLWEMGLIPFLLQQINEKKCLTRDETHRFKETERQQMNTMCGPCLDTDLNKPAIKYKLF